MTEQERLAGYIDVWWQAVHDFATLLEHLPAEQWSAPTDLAGWDVHAVAAHVAHLEGVLAGAPVEEVEIGQPPHVRSLMGHFTEQGVVARADRTPDELINEIRAATTARHTALLADPPADGAASPPRTFPEVDWTWETLLRNRLLGVWMHAQDVRRAVGRPGGLGTPAARHAADYLAESLGLVLAKRVGAPAGTTVVLEVDGRPPVAHVVNHVHRGERLPQPPEAPTTRLRTDLESFVVLAGGRRTPAPDAVTVDGDVELGRRLLESMAVTP